MPQADETAKKTAPTMSVVRTFRPTDFRKLTEAEDREWVRVKHEPLTKEDWLDLLNTLEDFKRRRIARNLQRRAEE